MKKSLQILLLFVMMAGSMNAWAQTDYSGIYYIGSIGYNSNNPASNFYLCPTEGWCSYKATDDFEPGDSNPFLTTYKCRDGVYDARNAVWVIDKAPNSDYYYIKHRKSQKYLVSNGQIRTAGIDRLRVHLESITDLAAQGDNVLFDISPNSNYLVISPQGIKETGKHDNNDHSTHKWLTVNGGNANSLKGASPKTGGPTGYTNTTGILGIFTRDDNNAKFYLEEYIQKPTITCNTGNEIEITVQSDATIIYTTDGTDPSLSNGNVVSSNTASFVPTTDGITVRAVAVVDGKLSKQISSFTLPVLCGAENTRLIQSQNNAWNGTDFHYYMIPGDEDTNNVLKVNTTSLFRPSMEWYFLNAGVENGVLYYYIVNNANDKYLCYDGTNKVYMDTYSDGNKFKFKIVESPTEGTFNIYPYGQNILINKNTDNANNAVINTISYSVDNTNNKNARWKFVQPSDLDKMAPFTKSDPSTGSYTYYQLRNHDGEYYVKAPATASAFVSWVAASAADQTTYWYLEEAAPATSSNWQTYYYIRNAKTGEYLYYAEGKPSANNSAFKTSASLGDADRYQFTWAHTTTEDYYFIVPRMLHDEKCNYISSMYRNKDKENLLVQRVRATGSSGWLFSEVSDFHCAPPVISWNTEAKGYVITSAESDAKIYYTIGDGALTTATGTLYSGAVSVADMDVESLTIRAIAARNTDGSDVSSEVSETVYKVATPGFSQTDNGKVQLTCATEGVMFYYEMGTSPANPTTSSTLYTGPIEGAAGKVIKAIAVKDGWINSAMATSETIVISCAQPVIRKTASNKFTIQCSFPTSGVSIYYTTNGSTPTSSSTLYTGEVTFNPNDLPFTIKAIATAVDYKNSEVAIKALAAGLTPDDDGYYEIVSAEDFDRFVQMVMGGDADKKYKITDDITLSESESVSVPFTGELVGVAKDDGSLPIIKGISHALFDRIDGGTVKNIVLDSVTISSGTNVGAIANEATGASRIYNCGVLATGSTVTTDSKGYTYITSCSSTIGGSGYVGGIVGLLDGSSRVINCFSYANITGGDEVGGIVGHNNVATTSVADNQKTMVMNCMFYGDITGGSSKAPIYNGEIITNRSDQNGVSNFNYFWAGASYVQNKNIDVYNCALAAETRYLQRFEFFRPLLNSNRELAAWWVTGSRGRKDEILKWVMEPSQIGTATPYPVLKAFGKYPSVVNVDAENAGSFSADEATKKTQYNQGRKFGALTINIRMGTDPNVAGNDKAYGALIKTDKTIVMANITDKDPKHFNYNYYKVQLPYYNEVGTKNYTDNKVVTGWKIVGISGGTTSFSTDNDNNANTPADAVASVGDDDVISLTTPYNFADRNCTEKDDFGIGKRVFSQGAYFDVPEGVSSITIEPYWGKCVFVADEYSDVIYDKDMTASTSVTSVCGKHFEEGTIEIDGVAYPVNTSMAAAVTALSPSGTVYDNAIVLVGNVHNIGITSEDNTESFTIMSIDLDKDNEPDYSYILRFNDRIKVHPVRIDFLNVIGLGMAQKSTGGKGTYNLGIMQPRGWFEVTNTGLFRVTQFEYDLAGRLKSPIILHGGVIEQWVTVGGNATSIKEGKSVSYYHVGGNVWFKEFHIGVHQDKIQDEFVSPHPPISVTGGDYDEFYLTGLYNTPNANYADNAECYINGGHFGKVVGTGMQGLGSTDNQSGNIIWQIDNADIKEFYAGGMNAAHIAEGNIMTVIRNSRVDQFCGGPKFGNMNSDKRVVTNATNCIFRTFFGAGYGGNSYNRKYPNNKYDATNYGWNTWLGQNYNNQYDEDNKSVATRIDYQFIPKSDNTLNVARLFIDYVSFSMATTHHVTSKLEDCTITADELGGLNLFHQCVGNFYGGGNLGKVEGPVKSTLINCKVAGNVFGAGYSASMPNVEVMRKTFQTEPKYDEDLGAYLEAELPATDTYKWVHRDEVNNAATAIDKTKHILYTTEDLNTLGAVTGDVTLTVNGITTVGKSVYGGGEESSVGGNTYVTIYNASVGNENQGGVTYGNVYGGGMGKFKDQDGLELDVAKAVSLGLVKGNTNVTIHNGIIYHNIYGGGAYGSVGTFTYDNTGEHPTGMPTACEEHTGSATVTILGGTIGTTGNNNGMIFGSSRGDVDAPGSIQDKLAWVHDTHVIIGGANANPQIKGSVYGGGENGHTFDDAEVFVHSGTIGILEGTTVGNDEETPDNNSEDATYSGVAFPYRGNVYGGGCGTDLYYTKPTGVANPYDGKGDAYNPLGGIVYGNASVTIDGGQVAHNVYGAGSMGSVGMVDASRAFVRGGATTVTISGGIVGIRNAKVGNVFGAARGDATTKQTDVALVKSTTVNISGSATAIMGNVYGGGESGDVGAYTTTEDRTNNFPEGSGICHVTVSGGTIAGSVFGAGKGEANTFECKKAMAHSTFVSITNGTVNGDVYGGGEVGRLETNTEVTIGEGDGVGAEETPTSAPVIGGSVYGGGAGVETHGYSALVRGNTTVTVQGNATVGASVFGGGEIASVGRYNLDAYLMPTILIGGGQCTVIVRGHAKIGTHGGGNVYGAGRGITPNYIYGTGDKSEWSRRMMLYSADFVKGKTEKTDWDYYENDSTFIWDYLTAENAYTTYLETLGLVIGSAVTITGNASVNGDVYGGGERGITKRDVSVSVLGGTIERDVYGGGALASTNVANWVHPEATNDWTWNDAEKKSSEFTTTVSLHGGIVGRNIYGGGLGRKAQDEHTPIKAKVYGDILVELNKNNGEDGRANTDNCKVKGSIFGCNNENGSPQGTVTVHIYKTVGYDENHMRTGYGLSEDDAEPLLADPDDSKHRYELLAVYGGGNQAAYNPDDKAMCDTVRPRVIIDGCDLTSIKTVYGGGNAASTPATSILINGTYEIEEVFGGGNGFGSINGLQNPGANVGFSDYSDVETTYDSKDKRLTDDFVAKYVYGSGEANVKIFGGRIHRVFGGSNTKGNVRKSAVTMLQEEGCHFIVDEAYGGGKNAPMDADAKLLMSCIPGLNAAYGGARAADIQGDVVLNITNGTFDRIFGGNNESGTIRGSIVVNIEETGCRPLIIGELYGGGNLAGYSKYGYKKVDDVWVPREAKDGQEPGTVLAADPQVNVRSFTSIGSIYGGGYGETAVMVGNPHVNINVTKGKYADKVATDASDPDYGVYDATGYKGAEKTIDGHQVIIPPHVKGKIGAIQNVYGGGYGAKVDGDTYVNIGTQVGESIVFNTPFTKTVNNIEVNTTSEDRTHEVKGVDIRGSIYGGGYGSTAVVTGNTNVQIGK
ncbi:FN3 associated domain-containing protein [Prevotella communis]|uniref:FN3 associated domain-containing protein n=1 Tax=Prevotella communis TaxID=2913614 RepID=UPI001EDA9EDA|nr:FN3 associated domain-containing protein [Prevotella communis]UKK56492.1 chitobiase/beta-hexosaminidase C-terminal domain-containing protein [Prevotella communis]